MNRKTTETGSYISVSTDERFISIALVSVLATLGTNVVSPALPALADALGVGDSQIGFVISMYSMLAMFFVPFTGFLSDIYGRRTVLLPSVLMFGLAGSVISIVNSFHVILLLRAIQGAAYAAIMPITVALLGDLYVGSKGSIAQGLRVGANGVGSTVVPVLAGILAGIAWNYPFLIYLIAFPILLVTILFLPETSRRSNSHHGISCRIRSYLSAIRGEVTQVSLRVLLFGESVRDFIRYGLLTFIPLFAVRGFGVSVALAGMVLSVRGIVYIIIGPVSGKVVERFSRREVLIGSMLLSAISIVLMPFSPSIVWLAGLFGVYTVGDSLFSPAIKDTVTAIASDEHRGGIVSGMNMFKYGGQASSPAVFGIVLGILGFESIFFISSAIAIIYALLVMVYVNIDL